MRFPIWPRKRRTKLTVEQEVADARRGFPWHFHPVDHHLPASVPSEADLMLWVEQEVERVARVGGLDSGTPFVLDRELDAALGAWLAAVRHDAADRERTARVLLSEQISKLTMTRYRLSEVVAESGRWAHEARHYRKIVNGGPMVPYDTSVSEPGPIQPPTALIRDHLEDAEDLLGTRSGPDERPAQTGADDTDAPIHLVTDDDDRTDAPRRHDESN